METAGPEELLIKVIPILETLKIEYCITGGLAVSVWGRPRATFDIDIVIKMVEPQVNSLAKALRKISEAGYIDENAAKEAIQHKGEFNFIDSESGLKIDFWVAKKDELSLLELKRKRLKKIGGQNIYFISPEDLILNKLQWYQESESTRHLEDIESVLKISGKILDKQYLKEWADKLGVLKILNELITAQ